MLQAVKTGQCDRSCVQFEDLCGVCVPPPPQRTCPVRCEAAANSGEYFMILFKKNEKGEETDYGTARIWNLCMVCTYGFLLTTPPAEKNCTVDTSLPLSTVTYFVEREPRHRYRNVFFSCSPSTGIEYSTVSTGLT